MNQSVAVQTYNRSSRESDMLATLMRSVVDNLKHWFIDPQEQLSSNDRIAQKLSVSLEKEIISERVEEFVDPEVQEHILATVTKRPFAGEYELEVDPDILDPKLQKIFGMAIRY